MAERGEENNERVSMELSDELLKAMEIVLAFRDYLSYSYLYLFSTFPKESNYL
jgi:hypothetical protein